MFLGWEPHPMNTNFDLAYLSGGDDVFGPNYGGATVYTNVRAGYLEECPNVGQLLKNLKFTLDHGERDHGRDPERRGGARGGRDQAWLKEHPEVLDAWLNGVTTVDGEPGLPAVKEHLGVSYGDEHRGGARIRVCLRRAGLAVPAPRASVMLQIAAGLPILRRAIACCRLRSAASVSRIRRLRPDPA